MRQIRILHVIDDLGAGGAQRQLVELLCGSDRSRYDHGVVSLSAERMARAPLLTDRGLDVRQVSTRGALDLPSATRLFRHMRDYEADVVQTWLFTADLYGRVAARLAGVPTVISSVRSTDPKKPRHRVRVDRFLDRWTTRYIVNARCVGTALSEREGITDRRITVIYNGVDVARFRSATADPSVRDRLGWTARDEIVGFVGRMRPEKRADLFVAMAALVRKRRPGARFLMVGGGPEQEAVERLIDRHDLRSVVTITPFQLDVVPVFRALDLLVSPSDYEGCSNVILEAMAAGVAVVATDVGGNRELLGDQVDLLVPPNDPSALAAAVEATLSSPEARAARAAEGLVRARERFSLERMVAAHESLYADLHERTSGSAGEQ